MEYIGHIESPSDGAPLTRDGWLEFIGNRPDLVRSPSRMVRNPATGQPIEAHPSPDAVQLVRDDFDFGSFSWAQDDSASVNVTCSDGCREFMAAAASEFAQLLGSVFFEYHANS